MSLIPYKTIQQNRMSQDSKDKLENNRDQNQQVPSPSPSPSTSSSSSRSSSFSNSISFLKLDEIESYEPPRTDRELHSIISDQDKTKDFKSRKMNSMPVESVQKMDQSQVLADKQQSLPVDIVAETMDKENRQQQLVAESSSKATEIEPNNVGGFGDFQIVDMLTEEAAESKKEQRQGEDPQDQRAALASIPNQLGDSLIDMIINLKSENRNLVKALEKNNEFVKERIEEFQLATEDSKRREAQYAMDRSEHEHQVRKLQRQNLVLSERLKSMESKLKDLKLEANEGSIMADSSKASSVKNDEQLQNLYPELNHGENFSLNQGTNMQVDIANGELNIDNDNDAKRAPPNNTSTTSAGLLDSHSNIETQDELLRQCNELEKQLNKIEKRDLEICLIQQKLNIFKKNLGTKIMNNFEAKGQIELLKAEIEGLCEERKRQAQLEHQNGYIDEAGPSSKHATTTVQAIDAASKLGIHLSKRATRSAVKAAKYASKQAYRERIAKLKNDLKNDAAMAAAAAINSGIYHRGGGASYYSQPTQQPYKQSPVVDVEPQLNQQRHHEPPHHHKQHHYRHHSASDHPHLSSLRKLKTEVVNDLMSTANKAMLTGYRVASTHVNLALDKLSQFEQTQAQNLAKNQKSNVGAETLHDYYNLDKNSLD